MAEVATGHGIEQFPTAFCRVADSVRLSRDEMIEGRIEGSQRPFVRCNGAQHIVLVHGPAEGLHEFLSLAILDTASLTLADPISKGFVIGSAACCSRVATRPSQK
jgi:hypothetical protein